MPNHIYSVLKIHYNGDGNTEEKNQELLTELATSKSDFDFNTIIPMPEDSETFFNRDDGLTSDVEAKFGKENTWYGWAVKNWGTKWNAYGIRVVKGSWNSVIYFQTAWNIPDPILKKLFEKYPEYDFTFVGVDEGGYFARFIKIDRENGAEKKTDVTWSDDNDPDSHIRNALNETLNE